MYANADENMDPFASKKAVQNSPIGGGNKARNNYNDIYANADDNMDPFASKKAV